MCNHINTMCFGGKSSYSGLLLPDSYRDIATYKKKTISESRSFCLRCKKGPKIHLYRGLLLGDQMWTMSRNCALYFSAINIFEFCTKMQGGTHRQILLRVCTVYISDAEPNKLGSLPSRAIQI